jgi:hypothetical protein
VADTTSRIERCFRTSFVAFALCLVALPAGAAPGDMSSDFTIDDEHPSNKVPTLEQRNESPLQFGYWLQDMILRGERAAKQKDWPGVIKYYEALARAVPDRAISFSRLCLAYGETGKMEIAAANCGKAIQLGGATVIDHFRFVNDSLAKPKLLPNEVADLDASITHLREKAPKAAASDDSAHSVPASDEERVKENFLKLRAKQAAAKLQGVGSVPPIASAVANSEEQLPVTVNLPLEIEMLACKLAARLEDARRLAACVGGLQSVKAPDALILPYEWSGALVAKDAPRAAALLERARSLGYPADALQTMLDEQEKKLAQKGVVARLKRWGWASWGIAALAVALGLVAWRVLSVRIRKLPPAPSA